MPRKIYYKVVTKDRRSISMEGSPFELYYKKLARTEAFPGSVGTLVFNTFENALNFKCKNSFPPSSQILKCHGHGRPTYPKKLIECVRDDDKWLCNFKKAPSNILGLTPPEGTVAFDAITCLE